MKTQLTETEDAVVMSPVDRPADATVIWLHGLGADGHDFVPLVPELNLPDSAAIRFVFPHAEQRPVTVNRGYPMRAWYDIRSLTPEGRDDVNGIIASQHRLVAYILRERLEGIAARRIVLAGFSQGGAMALHTAVRYDETLGGVLALSTYLPLRQSLAAEAVEANSHTPILMCHGEQDDVVGLSFALQSRDALLAAGYTVEWQQYPMPHSLCPAEIVRVSQWLRERLA